MQRYGQSSQFKRTVLEFIVEEMLAARSAEPGNALSCPVASGATPVVTSPSDSPLEFLYQQLNFSESDVVDRQQLSLGLQRLGKWFSAITIISVVLTPQWCAAPVTCSTCVKGVDLRIELPWCLGNAQLTSRHPAVARDSAGRVLSLML